MAFEAAPIRKMLRRVTSENKTFWRWCQQCDHTKLEVELFVLCPSLSVLRPPYR